MTARIYQRPKNAMQSGRAGTDAWVLDFERTDPLQPDPLTGWPGSSDTNRQLRLTFDSVEAAMAYAAKRGLDCYVQPPRPQRLKIQAYADNFK